MVNPAAYGRMKRALAKALVAGARRPSAFALLLPCISANHAVSSAHAIAADCCPTITKADNDEVSTVTVTADYLAQEMGVGVRSLLCVGAARLWVGLACGNIRVYDLSDKPQLLAHWHAHDAAVISAVQAGPRVYSLGRDGSVRGWSAALPGADDVAARSDPGVIALRAMLKCVASRTGLLLHDTRCNTNVVYKGTAGVVVHVLSYCCMPC